MDATLQKKEKELAAVAISIAAGCTPCTDYHVKAVREAGASENEIRQAMADALAVRASATQIIAGHALGHVGGAGHRNNPDRAVDAKRVRALVSVGAAFAVNCPSNLQKHLAAAEGAGIAREEIAAIAKLATFIKKMAASHVENLVGLDHTRDAGRQPSKVTGCDCR